jgi:lipid-A-disaccharide synthase
MKKKVLIIAGEVSGDLHASAFVREVRRFDPEIEFVGMGGEELRRQGVSIVVPSEELAVVGLTEVLPKIGKVLAAWKKLGALLENGEIRAVVLVDFPDFNLRIARKAYHLGIPVFYYISPQVWAWRPGRVASIARYVRKMAVVFPFEVDFYRSHGVSVEFVGHPLVERVRATEDRWTFLTRYGLDSNKRVIALMPGSRMSEIRRLLKPMLGAAERLWKEEGITQFLLPLASGISRSDCDPWLSALSIPVTVVEGETYNAIGASDVVVVASGTATLETALLARPMVVVYKTSWLTYGMGRILVEVPFIAMPNLILGRSLVPELLQGEVTAERIALEVASILAGWRSDIVEGLGEIPHRLGERRASEQAAGLFLEMLISA